MRIHREIARFDASLPVARAHTPPSSWYRGGAIFEAERDLFSANWQLLGPAEWVAPPGAYTAAEVAGEPVVLVRDDDGTLRALSNVCRHHAAELTTGRGRAQRLVCPYHGWEYALSGRLRRAPRMGRAVSRADIDRGCFDLPAYEVATAGPLVFARLRPGGPALADDLSPLGGLLDRAELRFVARHRYELACNWKVFVDNYLDGGYHVGPVHQGLAAQLDLASYRTEIAGRLVVQRCGDGAVLGPGSSEQTAGGAGPGEAAAGGTAPSSRARATAGPAASRPLAGSSSAQRDPPGRVTGGAVYAWLYPNLMLNRYGPFLDTNLVVPLGPERCITVFDYYVEPPAADLWDDAEWQAWLRRSLEASAQVQREDIAICESVQRGLASAGYERGRYAPTLEHGMHHFHRLLAADLRAATAGSREAAGSD